MDKNITEPTIITYDHEPIEKRWIAQWDKDQTYKAEIDKDKPKFYCLDTWVYPSAPDLGHLF